MLSIKPPGSKVAEGVLKAVEDVDREVALLAGHVSAENAAGLDEFRLAWGRLMDLLLLGRPTERRMCPFCGAVGAIDATWCNRCRKTLAPPTGGAA